MLSNIARALKKYKKNTKKKGGKCAYNICMLYVYDEVNKKKIKMAYTCSRMIECYDTILKTKYSQFRASQYARYVCDDSQLEKGRANLVSVMNYVFCDRSDEMRKDAARTYAHYQKLEKLKLENSSKIGTDYNDAEGEKLAAEEAVFEEMKDGFVKAIVLDLESIAAARFRVMMDKTEYEGCYEKEMRELKARIVMKRKEIDTAEEAVQDAKRRKWKVDCGMKELEDEAVQLKEEGCVIAFLEKTAAA